MIVEFSFDAATLQAALGVTSETRVEVDHITATDTIPLRTFFWAHGGDLDAFEAAIDDDPSVKDYKRITATENSRYYRLFYPDDAPDVDAHRAVVELDGHVLDASSTGNGWSLRVRFPDRTAANEWQDRCTAAGIDVTAEAVYAHDHLLPENSYGLTPAQREALLTAAETGYFSIPRETSLAGLGEELGVSSQSASERLRRGMITLIEHTLDED